MAIRNPDPPWNWGSVSDGNATGLCALMASGVVDLAVGDVYWDVGRNGIASFTGPFEKGSALNLASPPATAFRCLVYGVYVYSNYTTTYKLE